MHLSAAQLLFDRLFYGVMDVVFLILNIMAFRIVRGTRWRAYLGWIIPYVWGCGFQLGYRTIVNSHTLLGMPLTATVYSIAVACTYIGDIFGLYGTVILLRTLRQTVNGTLPEGPQGQMPHVIEEGVWPPPPSRQS